jgi:hypothetical protein
MKNSELLKKSPIYNLLYDQMMAYQNAYLGGYAFKQYVRKKRPSEDSNLYIDLINNTVAQPICRYIVDTINDVLFEPGVKRNLTFCTPTGQYIDPKNTTWSDLFALDADLNNRSITSFMEGIGDLTSIFGHCWVGVDMPQMHQGNLGRPYVCAISPLDVWDWEFDYYGGRPILKYVKIKEMEEEDSYYIKCYHLGDATTPSYWRSYEVEKGTNNSGENKDAELTGEGVFPLGMSIPVFIAYGRRDPRSIDFGISDIDAATDAQREHYKLECEAYSALQFAHTLIRADKGIQIPVHAGAIVRASEGQVEAIPVDTGDVDAILKKQHDILEQIEALSGLGGLRNTKNQIASGIAIIEERKQLHRLAKAKARLMEVTEEMIFTYAARFMDMRWAGEVHYNTDYEAHDTNYRMALIKEAKALVQDDPVINGLITKEIIAMLAPAEQIPEYEQAYIDTIENDTVRNLMTQTNEQVLSRDLEPSMIPTHEMHGEEDDSEDSSEEGMEGEVELGYEGDGTSSTILGGPGTPITNIGTSYYPQQAVAVQLTGLNVGR